MSLSTKLNETDVDQITALLVGHTVKQVGENGLLLDDGTLLTLVGHNGGCACDAGCYDLTELNGCDNIITNVEFVNSPSGDSLDGDGTYRIFVFADNQRINLATFEGTDGNGYYGTGYSIAVSLPRSTVPHPT